MYVASGRVRRGGASYYGNRQDNGQLLVSPPDKIVKQCAQDMVFRTTAHRLRLHSPIVHTTTTTLARDGALVLGRRIGNGQRVSAPAQRRDLDHGGAPLQPRHIASSGALAMAAP